MKGVSHMIDFLLYYSLGGVVWCVWTEVLHRKGFLARLGLIVFIPFVAITLMLESIRN